VLTANTVQALGDLGRFQPRLRAKVRAQLLRVEAYPHKTAECKRIAMGKVLDALAGMPDGDLAGPAVVAFAKRQAKSPRRSTKERARRLLDRVER
jgi:hypothetical protein